MDDKRDINNEYSDEVSLKDVILKIEEYIQYSWSKKWFILIPMLIFIGGFVLKAVYTPGTYKGETKFFLEGKYDSGIGALGGIFGQIGLGREKGNPYKVIEVSESKLYLADILFEKIGQDSAFIANKILEVYDLPRKWGEENPKYLNFKFAHDSVEKFNNLENKVLLNVIAKVIDNSENNALVVTKLNDEKGFYTINVKTLDHDLTMRLSEVCYENLKFYFEEKTREKLKNTRDLLKVRRDSIKYALDSKVQEHANFRDRNRALVYNAGQTKRYILEAEIQGLTVAYTESLKSYEIADYKYMDRSNYFMIIDRPRAPLRLKTPSWKTEAIKGGLLGFILSIGILFMIKIYREIMNPKSPKSL